MTRGGLESDSRPHVGFGGLMTNNLRSNLVLRVFVVYNIQKGNTNDEINFYMGYNEEKGKVTKIL
jgi:hypothetical protein